MDLVNGELFLLGWDVSYSKEEMKVIMDVYVEIDEEKFWENFIYFIKCIIFEVEVVGVKMVIYLDDLLYFIFGLFCIIIGLEVIECFVKLYDSKSNGIILCVGFYVFDF